MSTISLRELKENDLEFLIEIRNECHFFLHNASEFSLKNCKEWFQKTNPKFFIIENEGNPIGYFRTSDWTDNSCWVGGDLHKDFRGRGLMKTAYYKLFDYLKSINISIVYLSVLSFNEVAYNLYKNLGFETTSITDFSQIGTDKKTTSIQMIKKL